MKKICFITTIPLTFDVFIFKTAEYLHNQNNWDVSVICNTDVEFTKRLPEYIHYFPVPMERGISITGINAMIQMTSIFRKEKFDIIQYSTPNASLYASMAGYFAKIPVRLYCQWGIAYVGFKGIKRKVFKMIETLVCKLSTWIEPDSNSNLIFCHEEKLYGESKGSVIWNGSACGVNLMKFDISKKSQYRTDVRLRYNIPEDAFVFGFVGRITRDKGVNELLQAFRKLEEKHINIYLLMVGPCEVDQTINSQLYNWSKEDKNVIYTGYTNCVEQFLAAMDTYILPSYREGFGMGVVEAEAMGVPVVVTNIPGPIDAMVPDVTGVIVEKQDVKSLYSVMRKMLISNTIKEYGTNGVKYATEKFDQSILMQKIAEDREGLLKASSKNRLC